MDSRGELPYSTLLWQPRPATWLVTIVCKATFSLEPGEAKLAEAQEPLFEHDAYWDDDSKRSLSAASDLSPTKPKVDVVLVGHAFAPPGKAVRSLVARLVVESIDKSIELVADRSVGPDGTIYQGHRFARMPLVYERAAGGQGTWNPVGIDTKSRDKFGRSPLPNLTQVGRGDDTMTAPDPIGFGPVAPSWPLRENKLGYHRATITSDNWRKEPLPEGFDLGFFNVAPADQQLDAIGDTATLLLENLHPRHAVLSTKLPGVRPRFTVMRRSGATDRPAMRPDTLVIDSDRSIATLTWRGHFALDHQGESYRVAQSIERPRQSWRTVEHAIAPRETMLDALASERTSAGEELARDVDATPFDRRGAAADPRSTSGGAGLPFQQARARDAVKSTNPGLPFGEGTATNAAPGLPPTPPGMAPLPPPGQTATIQGGLPFADQPAPGWSGAYPTAASMGVRPPTFATPAPTLSASPAPSTNQPPTVPPPPPPQSVVAPMPMAAPVAQLPPPSVPQPLSPPSSAPAAAWSGVSGAPVAPPLPVLMHASTAALGGLVSASNAAADGRPTGANTGRAPRKIEGDVLQLLWWSPEVAARVRRKAEWKKILDQLEQGPFDPEVDEPSLADEPGEMEDRREVYEVIARGTPSGQDGVDFALLDAVRADGRFAAQLLLLVGEVRFDFDELELLKATVSAATPFASGDEELKKTLEQATAFLSTPGLVASPDVATSMTTRIREVFCGVSRPVAPSYLDDQTERALLERRAYQKRSVFGEPHLRSLFFLAGSSTGIPTYFPEGVAKKLPLFRRLRVRMIVEAHFQADQYESHSAAMKVAAVARIVR